MKTQKVVKYDATNVKCGGMEKSAELLECVQNRDERPKIIMCIYIYIATYRPHEKDKTLK